MDINVVMSYMSDYGLLFLAIIIFVEYLNLPGFPAGMILPVAGVWAVNTGVSFWMTLIVATVTALIASWILYAIGWYGGDWVIRKYITRFPKQKDYIEDKMCYLKDKGNIGVFVSKLIPVARTVIGIPAGALKLNFISYTLYSILGIALWNGVLMFTGYYFGEQLLATML